MFKSFPSGHLVVSSLCWAVYKWLFEFRLWIWLDFLVPYNSKSKMKESGSYFSYPCGSASFSLDFQGFQCLCLSLSVCLFISLSLSLSWHRPKINRDVILRFRQGIENLCCNKYRSNGTNVQLQSGGGEWNSFRIRLPCIKSIKECLYLPLRGCCKWSNLPQCYWNVTSGKLWILAKFIIEAEK